MKNKDQTIIKKHLILLCPFWYQLLFWLCFGHPKMKVKWLSFFFLQDTSTWNGKLLTMRHRYMVYPPLKLLVTLVQFSHSVVSDSLWPHDLQHARPACPSPTPRVHPDSCPSSQWCHPAISSSVVPFSSCPNPSQHQGLFQWVNSSHQVAKVLEFQL